MSYTRLNDKRFISKEIKEKIEIEKDYKTTYLFLNEATTFPYTLTYNSTGLTVINNSTANELTITLTYLDATTIAIPIPALSTYEGKFGDFSIINAGGSTDFDLGVQY